MTKSITELKKAEQQTPIQKDAALSVSELKQSLPEKSNLKKRKLLTPVPTGGSIAGTFLFVPLLFAMLLLCADGVFILVVTTIVAIGIASDCKQDLLRLKKFNASPKQTVQATIIDRKVHTYSDSKGGTRYTYCIIYAFEVPQLGEFTFFEYLNKREFDRTYDDEPILVVYAVADPELARRRKDLK